MTSIADLKDIIPRSYKEQIANTFGNTSFTNDNAREQLRVSSRKEATPINYDDNEYVIEAWRFNYYLKIQQQYSRVIGIQL